MIAPLGLSIVAIGDLRADVLELQALRDQLGRIDLDADRRLLLAADAHQRHAGDLADLLGEDVLGGVVDLVIGAVSEATERIRIGESAGLTLR